MFTIYELPGIAADGPFFELKPEQPGEMWILWKKEYLLLLHQLKLNKNSETQLRINVNCYLTKELVGRLKLIFNDEF